MRSQPQNSYPEQQSMEFEFVRFSTPRAPSLEDSLSYRSLPSTSVAFEVTIALTTHMEARKRPGVSALAKWLEDARDAALEPDRLVTLLCRRTCTRCSQGALDYKRPSYFLQPDPGYNQQYVYDDQTAGSNKSMLQPLKPCKVTQRPSQ